MPMNTPKVDPKSDFAKANAQGEDRELADVVIAAQTHDEPFRPWYITLRPWLFCLLFLALAEIGARLYYDTGLSLRRERFDNFPTAATENAFVAQMRRDKAYKVVLVGDSTIVGSALLEHSQTLPRYLEDDLARLVPGREIHVWNLSLAGARSPDMLCLLRKALEGKPDFVVVEGNYYIAAMGVGGAALAEPWLAYNLTDVPPAVLPYVPARDAKKRMEDGLTAFVEDKVRFVGMRQAINASLFGVQPRVPYPDPNPLLMAGVHAARLAGQLSPQVWSRRGPNFAPEHFMRDYKNDFSSEDIYPRFYRDIVAELQRSGLPCLTYMTPQNPAVTNLNLDDNAYKARRQKLAVCMTGAGIPNKDYSSLVPDPLFNDNDHMMAEGNHKLADALAQEIAPRIQGQISGSEKPHPLAGR